MSAGSRRSKLVFIALCATLLPVTLAALVAGLEGAAVRRHGAWYAMLLLTPVLALQGAAMAAVFRPDEVVRLLRGRVGLALGATLAASAVMLAADASLGARQRRHSDRLMAREYRRRDAVRHHALIGGAVGAMPGEQGLVEYRLNALGYRGPEVGYRKPPGAVRLMVLGDSFAEGWRVAEEAGVAGRLREGLRPGVEVVNASVASYSPLLEYLYLEHEGFALDPDLILLFWDLADVQDDWGRDLLIWRDAAGRPVALAPDPIEPDPPLPGLLQRLSGFWLGGPAVGQLKATFRVQPQRERRPYGNELLEQVFRGDLENFRWPGPTRLINTFEHIGQALEPAWRVTETNLERIRAWCASQRIALVVVLYPYGHLVSAGEWTRGRAHFGIAPDTVASDAPLRRMETFLTARGVPVINTLSAMKAAARPDRPNLLFDADDPHWTAEGHRVVAGEVLRQLVSRNLVPSPRPPRYWRLKERAGQPM